MVQIVPGILTQDIEEVQEYLAAAQGVVDRVQIDIIDGEFAHNETIDPSALNDIFTDLRLDFHLMVKEPEGWIEKCVNAMADRIYGQIEEMNSQAEFVRRVQEAQVSVGLALDLSTPVASLDPTVLPDVDSVLLMSVPAGFEGQDFDEDVYGKLKKLNEKREEESLAFKICIDGGITEKHVKKLEEFGAHEIVIGDRIFKGGLRKNLKKYNKPVGGNPDMITYD